MNAFAHHLSFEFRIGIRNRQLLFLTYLFPLIFYLFMGFLMVEINPFFGDNLIPAMVIFTLLATTLLGLPELIVGARELGIFRSYKINGVPSGSILAVPALTTMMHTTVVSAIIIATAPLLFDAPLPSNWLYFVVVYLAVAFAAAGIGVLIGVISPSSRSTMFLSQMIFIPSMLLAGLMLPPDALPEAFEAISQVLPATHGMNALNGLAMVRAADTAAWRSVILLFVGGILSFALASYLFSWDSKNSTRRGHPIMALIALVPYLAAIFLM